MEPVYKRLLLKLSGEVLAGEAGHGFDFNVINDVCNAVKKVTDKGGKYLFVTNEDTARILHIEYSMELVGITVEII